jgi:hypothetical protein
VLVTDAGRQEAVQGSYCVTEVSEGGEGVGICADTAFVHPEQLGLVRPSEKITIQLAGASLGTNAGCSPACPSIATVYPLGCGPDQPVAEFELGSARAEWTVDLEPGAYELVVFAYFETEDGRSGDTSGALGLLVDPTIDPAGESLPAAIDPYVVCPYPGQH